MMDDHVKNLYRISYELRKKTLEMVYHARNGHAAPSLSMSEILTTLYFHVLNIDPANPLWKDRDRFVLSKGHACPIYYAALAKRGFFPEEELMEYRMVNTKLQGHPDMNKCPGCDMTTGSLGNGFSLAMGMALVAKKDGKKHRVYTLTGDGELQEGIIWEAAMYAGNAGLSNLTAIVDHNGLQSGGNVSTIQNIADICEKFRSFGWNVQEIDGHDIKQIITAIGKTKECTDKPSIIIAHTTKGKGVSFMEGQYLWHMKSPNDEEFAKAVEELDREVAKYE